MEGKQGCEKGCKKRKKKKEMNNYKREKKKKRKSVKLLISELSPPD